MLILKEVFEDFDIVVGSTFRGRNRRKFKIKRLKNPKKLTLDDLKDYADYLYSRYKRKYPNRAYILAKVRIMDGMIETEEYSRIKQSIKKLERLRFPSVIDRAFLIHLRERLEKLRNRDLYVITSNVPIFFDLEEQRFYVKKELLEREPKLTSYVLMRALGALGVSQSKYVGPFG